MPDRESISIDNSGFLAPQTHDFRLASPPKTPIPMLSMDEACSQRPDWHMSTPEPLEDYFQRPTSALSNASDFSDDSFYSGSRASRPSDDGSCTSPESDIADPFQFPSISRGKGRAIMHEEPAHLVTLNGKLRSKTRKNAPWTKAMSSHLWSTYMLYLQDPTVTPFRIGASTVPPEGVCHRVAREARRSWRGPKLAAPTVRRSSRLSSVSGSSRASDKSGSITPTGETPKAYVQWPHSSAATRNRLRELCKSKDTTAVQRHRHLQSRSPTPFTKSYQLRTSEPPRLSTFNTKDIALSLTTSTAETMQPNGPLAKLASDESADTPTINTFPSLEDFNKPLGFGESRGLGISMEDGQRGRRLGSPFIARTYGPSSSKALNAFDPSRPSPPRTQSDTVSGPYLRSPLRFEKPRSLNGTQKRRAQHALEEELSPSGAVLRPSILNEQLFGTPLNNQRRVRSRGFSLGDEAFRNRVPGLPQASTTVPSPRPQTSTPPTQISPEIIGEPEVEAPAPKLLPSATFAPPARLGSPFSESGSSNTFPRRLFQDGSATIRRSAFATMHQTRRSIESFDFGEGPSLQSRLEHLDMKLKEIRERDAASRRQPTNE